MGKKSPVECELAQVWKGHLQPEHFENSIADAGEYDKITDAQAEPVIKLVIILSFTIRKRPNETAHCR